MKRRRDEQVLQEGSNNTNTENQEEITATTGGGERVFCLFEERIISDLLICIFEQYYAFPLSEIRKGQLLAPRLVNRRWKAIFEHPLDSFVRGHFTSSLLNFPPMRYIVNDLLWCKINDRGGMIKIMQNTTEDYKQMEFIRLNMFYHHFDTDIQCRNQELSDLMYQLRLLKIEMYNPWQHLQLIQSMINNQILIKAILFFHYPFSQFQTKFQDKEFSLLAVKAWGSSLELVPHVQRTEGLCKFAVKQDAIAIQHVPTQILNESLCIIAVGLDPFAFKLIPADLQTTTVVKTALRKAGEVLRLVPTHSITDEICKIAVSQNAQAISFVPKHLRTEEIYELVIHQDYYFLHHIDLKEVTNRMCEMVLRTNHSDALNGIPFKKRTRELCGEAVRQNGSNLMFVPSHLRTPELCRIAVEQSCEALKFVPKHLKDDN